MNESRQRHLTASALALAMAVIESAPREWQASSDLDCMDEMLSEICGAEERAMYERSAWNVAAAVGLRPLRPSLPSEPFSGLIPPNAASERWRALQAA